MYIVANIDESIDIINSKDFIIKRINLPMESYQIKN